MKKILTILLCTLAVTVFAQKSSHIKTDTILPFKDSTNTIRVIENLQVTGLIGDTLLIRGAAENYTPVTIFAREKYIYLGNVTTADTWTGGDALGVKQVISNNGGTAPLIQQKSKGWYGGTLNTAIHDFMPRRISWTHNVLDTTTIGSGGYSYVQADISLSGGFIYLSSSKIDTSGTQSTGGEITVTDTGIVIGGSTTIGGNVSVTGNISADTLKGYYNSDPGYKVYTALLTQTGTGNPTATVLENTLGFNPTLVRMNAGNYAIQSAFELFTVGKTFVIQGGINYYDFPAGKVYVYQSDNANINIDCYNNSNPSDDVLVRFPVEIRIYP